MISRNNDFITRAILRSIPGRGILSAILAECKLRYTGLCEPGFRASLCEPGFSKQGEEANLTVISTIKAN